MILRTTAISLIALLFSGMGMCLAATSSSTDSDAPIPIIMLHHIRPITKNLGPISKNLSYSPESLRKLAQYLVDNNIATLQVKDLQLGQWPSPAAILTFDDSYDDFYTQAYPILKEFHLRATIFVITDMLDLPGRMTQDEIKEVAASGLIEIGSHTLTHPDLRTLKKDELKKEVEESKTKLEAMIGSPVISFCYPGGEYNARVRKAVADAGYLFARTTHNGYVKDLKKPLDLPMLRVLPNTGEETFRKWWKITTK